MLRGKFCCSKDREEGRSDQRQEIEMLVEASLVALWGHCLESRSYYYWRMLSSA